MVIVHDVTYIQAPFVLEDEAAWSPLQEMRRHQLYLLRDLPRQYLCFPGLDFIPVTLK